MNWLTKAASTVKALVPMRHPARASGWGTLLRRTRFDYRREVGDGLDSSVVTAPVQFLQRSLPEARLAMKRRKVDGTVEALDNHDLLALIQNPNDHYGDIALWAGTILSRCIDGNAYWLKVRNRAGRVKELWYIPHWMMEPRAPSDGSKFVDHYLYSPGGVEPVTIDPADVVHFRHGINPHDLRKGLSPIHGVLREIFMDLEASNFVASLLRNMGVPGVVISPKGGAMPATEDVEATKSWFQEAFGGDRRGGPLVMGAPTDVNQYGYSPQQMDMGDARDVPEERICACLGIPAAVVGFGVGLQQTKVGATMGEMRKLAWHNGVLPMGRELVDELKRSLLPDFEGDGDGRHTDLYWETEDVLALQEDENAQTERKLKEFSAGAITLYDYLQETGREANASHRYYLRPFNLVAVPEAQAGTGRDPVGSSGKAFGTKARASEGAIARADVWLRMLQRQEEALQKAFETPLRSLFAGWGKEAGTVARTMAPRLEIALATAEPKAIKAPGDDALIAQIMAMLDTDAWRTALTQAYGAHYLNVANAVQDAAERAGLGANLPDPVARAVVATGGRRVGLLDLDDQTRGAIFDALAEGRAEGEGVQQLADRIAIHVEAGPWNSGEYRAQLIARTETKFAQNFSTIQRALDAGVTSFIVFDGRFGLPRSTPSHIARNGSIASADEALAMAASEHPNGTLSFAPNFEE
tara:strand:+ start:364 stop:2457 length:2094 start_codon:yes stop_codon:yes gene_type:complete